MELARTSILGARGRWEFHRRGGERPGLVGLLRDPQFGPIVALLLQTLEHPWDAEELAQRMGLGRKALCGRLRETADILPFELLTALRMQRASRLLAMPETTLKQLPPQIGYRSLPACASAFTKLTRLTLGESRDLRRFNWTREFPQE